MKLDAEAFPDARVIKAVEQFVPIRLAYHKEGKELAQKYQVLFAPTLVTVDASGELHDRFLAYQAPARLVKMLGEAIQACKSRSKDESLADRARKAASRREYEVALKLGRELLSKNYRDEDVGRTFLALGEAFFYGKKYREGIEMFEGALSTASTVDERGWAYVCISWQHWMLKENDKAIWNAEQTLKLKDVNKNYIEYAKGILEEIKKT